MLDLVGFGLKEIRLYLVDLHETDERPFGSTGQKTTCGFPANTYHCRKNLATEMTNYNVEEKDLQGESAITVEHVENNTSVRDMLGQRGIKPEDLPASEDIKKLERRVKREEKKLAEQSGKLTNE